MIKSISKLLPIIFFITIATGCIKQQYILKVNPDGSGNLAVTRIYSAQAVSTIDAQMNAMQAQFDSSDGMFDIPTNIYFNEEMLIKEANLYGLDIEFVKAKPFQKNGARGAVALYAFKNIGDVVIPSGGINPEMMGSVFMPGSDETMPIDQMNAYSFALTKGEKSSTLTINLPEMEDAIEVDEEISTPEMEEMNEPIDPEAFAAMQAMGNPMGLTGNETGAQIMEQMMGDMKMSIQVIINGKILNTNAEFVDATRKNRITLVDFDFKKIIENDGLTSLMAMSMDPEAMSSPSAFRNMQGVNVETNDPVTIEFESN